MTEPFPLSRLADERRLRVFREPCWGDAPRAEREWFVELRGRGTVLYGNDATSFWVETTSGRLGGYDLKNPTWSWCGDGEGKLLYNIGQFDEVVSIMNPRKRRTFTPEQLKAMSDRLAIARKTLDGDPKTDPNFDDR